MLPWPPAVRAQPDTIYAPPFPRGISWIHRWMLAKGLPMQEEPLEPEWIRKLAQSGR